VLATREKTMDESVRRTVEFLEKEIKTYQALSLFFSKKEISLRAQVNASQALISPTYYKARMKEAKRLVAELRKSN
jgi:hypothetical protein